MYFYLNSKIVIVTIIAVMIMIIVLAQCTIHLATIYDSNQKQSAELYNRYKHNSAMYLTVAVAWRRH